MSLLITFQLSWYIIHETFYHLAKFKFITYLLYGLLLWNYCSCMCAPLCDCIRVDVCKCVYICFIFK